MRSTATIEKAINYVLKYGADDETKNDAANIFASTYCEYLELWNAIREL